MFSGLKKKKKTKKKKIFLSSDNSNCSKLLGVSQCSCLHKYLAQKEWFGDSKQFANVTEVVAIQSIIIIPQELWTGSWHKWELALKPNNRWFKEQLPEYCYNLQLLQSCSVLWSEFRVDETLKPLFWFVLGFLKGLICFCWLKSLMTKQ